ncbi:MAG: hypothetical protein MUE69_33705 [Myxococcota bacterium]|jgi:YD repeat-containing protein|nr:hypothetical protein [Myxococcota bacterium]
MKQARVRRGLRARDAEPDGPRLPRALERRWCLGRLQTDADRARELEGLGEDKKKSQLGALYGSSKMVNALRLPNGGVVAYRYDERGRRTRVDDARGGRVQMRYDTEDRGVEVMSPTGLPRTMAYDAEGNVVRIEDATRSIRFAYGPTRGEPTSLRLLGNGRFWSLRLTE